MGTLMQMLLEVMRANVEDKNKDGGILEHRVPDEMSGFILENVQVATTQHEEEEEINPLSKLLYEEEKSVLPINMLRDHLERLEKKVRRLELSIPPNKGQQRLWLAPVSTRSEKADPSAGTSGTYASESGGSYMDEPEYMDEPPRRTAQKSTSQRDSPPSKHSRVASKPLRLEKEEGSCFARLLFSRCWTAKNREGGWRVKQGCPSNYECPCGDIGPCAEVKRKACPISDLKSTKKKDAKKPTSSRVQNEGQTFATPSHSKSKTPKSKSCAKGEKPTGKPLIEKLLPCCFKDHVHNECCCRCHSNPKLTARKRKPSRSKSRTKSPRRSREATSTEKTEGTEPEDAPSDETDDYYNKNAKYEGNQEQFSALSMSRLHRNKYDTPQKLTSNEVKTTSKHKVSNVKSHFLGSNQKVTTAQVTETENPVSLQQSTTSFQVVLHPALSSEEIPEGNIVSHQILKTLSTMHGPVKVEQKIVVQGTSNAVVIVTHGKACECSLCCMLKSKNNNETNEGITPQVVKFSTKDGYNTLINHSDGCACELCAVLYPSMANNSGKRMPKLENENIVMAACSSVNDTKTIENSILQKLHSNDDLTEPSKADGGCEIRNTRKGLFTTKTNKKLKCKAVNGKKKVKKCQCTKCRQRRRIEKLKLRLNKELGLEEYEKLINGINRWNQENEYVKINHKKISAKRRSDDTYEKPKRNRMVSFSEEASQKRERETDKYHTTADAYEKLERKDTFAPRDEIISEKIQKSSKQLRNNHIISQPTQFYRICSSSQDSECDPTTFDGRISIDGSNEWLRIKSRTNVERLLSSEKQKCFPSGHTPEKWHKKPKKSPKQIEIKDLYLIEQDRVECPKQHKEKCSEKFRLTSSEEINQFGEGLTLPNPDLLDEGSFPQKYVYWSPTSRSNMATAYSSESYYIPDKDEFPIVDHNGEESVQTSNNSKNIKSNPQVHHVQLPGGIWFRMMPDRNAR